MNTFTAVVILSLVTGTAALDCVNGILDDGCCVCHTGWKLDNNNQCTECADGFVMDPNAPFGEKRCSNGRPGSACKDDAPFPHFGCGGVGTCSPGISGPVFPCKCDGGSCETLLAKKKQKAGSCYPAGTRMYTTFPNEPQLGKKFSLTFVGCELASTDSYVVLPAFKGDDETSCSQLLATRYGGVPEQCRFRSQAVTLSSNDTDCTRSGIHLSELTPQSQGATNGMTEHTYHPITINEDALLNDYDDRLLEFRVCKKVMQYSREGTMEVAWKLVANHDDVVSKRDETFRISRVGAGANAAGENTRGSSCCEGLRVGSLCLPLWAFLLLWFLMALCLCTMGYTLHKNKNEIEAQRNNEKYERFNVDAEMSNLAAKEADDDDDI